MIFELHVFDFLTQFHSFCTLGHEVCHSDSSRVMENHQEEGETSRIPEAVGEDVRSEDISDPLADPNTWGCDPPGWVSSSCRCQEQHLSRTVKLPGLWQNTKLGHHWIMSDILCLHNYFSYLFSLSAWWLQASHSFPRLSFPTLCSRTCAAFLSSWVSFVSHSCLFAPHYPFQFKLVTARVTFCYRRITCSIWIVLATFSPRFCTQRTSADHFLYDISAWKYERKRQMEPGSYKPNLQQWLNMVKQREVGWEERERERNNNLRRSDIIHYFAQILD